MCAFHFFHHRFFFSFFCVVCLCGVTCSPVLIVNKEHIAHTTCCHRFQFTAPPFEMHCHSHIARVILSAQVGLKKIADQHGRMWVLVALVVEWLTFLQGMRDPVFHTHANRLMTEDNIFIPLGHLNVAHSAITAWYKMYFK